MSDNLYVAIMAGGVGSRFWPASRESCPKQFHDITNTGESLLVTTYKRFLKIIPAERIFVVTHVMYKDLVKEHLHGISNDNIVCEPSRNNTAPSVAYISFKIKKRDENAVVLVAPSDHLIEKNDLFLSKILEGYAFCNNNDALLTLGIEPTRPDTGYGYIHFEKTDTSDIKKVKNFREKPDYDTAVYFYSSGQYVWNAGIFLWSVKSICNAFEKYQPKLFELFNDNIKSLNTPAEDDFIKEKYPTTENISIDYAILEKADNVYTMPVDIGWSDLGTWKSVHEIQPKDGQDNVTQGNITLIGVKSSLIRSSTMNKKIVVSGLENFMIVDTPDALLIYPMDKEQEVKNITQKLKEAGETNYL